MVAIPPMLLGKDTVSWNCTSLWKTTVLKKSTTPLYIVWLRNSTMLLILLVMEESREPLSVAEEESVEEMDSVRRSVREAEGVDTSLDEEAFVFSWLLVSNSPDKVEIGLVSVVSWVLVDPEVVLVLVVFVLSDDVLVSVA